MHYLHNYKTFENTQQLNTAIYEHIRNNSYNLTETDRVTLKLLARYSVKYSGACHLKAATIAEKIEKSEKTARRVITKLVELGIIEKVATMRKVNGGKGANIIRILPPKSLNDQSNTSNRVEEPKPTESKGEQATDKNEPSNYSKQEIKSTLQETRVPSNALRQSLPTEIYDAMARYWEASDIYKYYGILLRAKRSISKNITIEDNASLFVDALHNAILKVRLGKVGKLANYLYVAWQNASAIASRRQNRSGMAQRFADIFDA
jgi:predicted transcriptional regulator